MRTTLATLLATLLIAQGCSACEAIASMREDPEVHTDLPTTISEVRAWAPDGSTVDVRRRSKSSGGACGHSIVCVIVLPIAIGEAIVPSMYDIATVRRGAVIEFQGMFDLRGRIVSGRMRDDDHWREIARLPLDELGVHPTVETAHVAIGDDGRDGARTRLPIGPQVDLIPRYRAAIAAARFDRGRANLLIEAVRFLEDEAMPMVDERAARPAMTTLEREEAFVFLERSGIPEPRQVAVVEALATSPGPRLATRLITHPLGLRLSPAKRAHVAAVFVERLCAEVPNGDSQAAIAALRADASLRTQALREARGCTPTRRVFVRAILDAATPEDEILAALTADEHATWYVAAVTAGRPSVGFTLVARHPEARDPIVFERFLESRLPNATTTTPADAFMVSVGYVHARARPRERFVMLGILGGADAAAALAARAPLEGAYESARGETRALIAAALVATDDRSRIAEPLALIGDRDDLTYTLSILSGDPTKAQLAAAAFRAAACTDEQIRRAARAAHAGEEIPRCGGIR